MLQIILTIFTIVAAALAVFAVASRLKCSSGGLSALLYELDLRLADLPAQVAFFMFSITAAMAAGVISSLTHIPSLWIITLDILFAQNVFLLVKFHRLKLHPSVSL